MYYTYILNLLPKVHVSGLWVISFIKEGRARLKIQTLISAVPLVGW